MCRKMVFRRQLKTPGKKEHPKRKKYKQKFFHLFILGIFGISTVQFQ